MRLEPRQLGALFLKYSKHASQEERYGCLVLIIQVTVEKTEKPEPGDESKCPAPPLWSTFHISIHRQNANARALRNNP